MSGRVQPASVPAAGEPVLEVRADTGSMGRAVAGGAGWSSLGRLGSQALQFLASLVLARLIAPTEFGLVASVLVFTQFALIFFELGLGAALVQLRDLRQQDLATVFWINALGGLVFAGLLALCAPLIAGFYGEPGLRGVVLVVSLTFTLNLGVCHLALLQRAMRFKQIALAELTAAATGFAVTIALAVAGLGVYALAIGPVVQSVTMTILLWSLVRWRPHHFVVRASVVRIRRFSAGMLGFNVVNYWGRNADNLLVGRFVGAEALGFYNRAFNLMTLPVQQLSQVLGRVMFPALVAMREDKARMAAAYRRTVASINAVSVPVLVGMTAVAPALVPALWGQRWTPTVPLLMVICMAGVPQAMATSVGWIYQSQNRTTTMFAVGSVSAAAGVLAMVVGLRWGALGVAVAVLLRSWLLLLPTLHFATRLIDLRARRVVADTLPTWGLCAVMFVVVWWLPPVLGAARDGVAVLLAQVGTGALVYGGGMLLFRRAFLRELRVALRPRAAA